MKSFRFFNLIALLLVFLIGCTIVNIDTTKRAELEGPYHKIYIFINILPEGQVFMDGFTKNLKQELDERNVRSEIYIIHSLGLETSEEIKRIKDYEPDAILIIRQTRSTVSSATLTSGSYDLQIFNDKLNNILWSATMHAHSDRGIKHSIAKASQSLIMELEENKIIAKSPE